MQEMFSNMSMEGHDGLQQLSKWGRGGMIAPDQKNF
jgi:hypothetical protein